MARRSAARLEEVTDLEAAGPRSGGMSLEEALILVTSLALIVGLVLGQVVLSKYFGAGLLG